MIVFMPPRQRPRNSAGTYGPIGVLLHPSRIFRQPAPEDSQADLEAVLGGQTRRVCCFLRGSFAPFPPRPRQGWLYLWSHRAQWKPSFSIRRPAQQITGPITSVVTRRVDHREPNVRKGSRNYGPYGLYGAAKLPTFSVVTCQTPSGSIDLVVPTSDLPLVVGYFTPVKR